MLNKTLRDKIIAAFNQIQFKHPKTKVEIVSSSRKEATTCTLSRRPVFKRADNSLTLKAYFRKNKVVTITGGWITMIGDKISSVTLTTPSNEENQIKFIF